MCSLAGTCGIPKEPERVYVAYPLSLYNVVRVKAVLPLPVVAVIVVDDGADRGTGVFRIQVGETQNARTQNLPVQGTAVSQVQNRR